MLWYLCTFSACTLHGGGHRGNGPLAVRSRRAFGGSRPSVEGRCCRVPGYTNDHIVVVVHARGRRRGECERHARTAKEDDARVRDDDDDGKRKRGEVKDNSNANAGVRGRHGKETCPRDDARGGRER